MLKSEQAKLRERRRHIESLPLFREPIGSEFPRDEAEERHRAQLIAARCAELRRMNGFPVEKGE